MKKTKRQGKTKKLNHGENCDKDKNKRLSSPLRKQSSRRYKFTSLQIGDFHFESNADCELSHVALYHRLNQMIYEFDYEINFGVKLQDACRDDESTNNHQYHYRQHDHSSPKVRQVLNVIVTIIVPLNSVQRITAIDKKMISLEMNETPRIITRLQDRQQWSKIFGCSSYCATIDVTDGQLEVSRRHTIVLARCSCASLADFFGYFEPHIIYDKCLSSPITYICSPRGIDSVENLEPPLNEILSNPDMEKHNVATS
uniref:Uncharacterized protein n=1 Tax=Romanomermis culicivorax TaxID=13658 RepID=A0A915INL8_ROMCU